MVIANTNKHIAPYWGEEPTLVAGLNQLGIRNVSEQLFTVLLPGLNNVSIRIRYYSFYCWIIKQFYEGKQTVIDKEFNPFIRRAELLVALINATLEDRSGIPGINFATSEVDSGAEFYSLKEGADIEQGKTTYWANQGGILRQYYVASLEEMGLIGQNEKYPSIYNITKTDGYINGQMLADEFAESIGDVAAEMFLGIIQRGYVTKEELKSLNGTFRMKYLSGDSNERDTLQRKLLEKDNPTEAEGTAYRRETIKYILEYLSMSDRRLTAAGFARYMYENYSNTNDLTSWGWYAYYLDNNWQYQLTQIFHDILTVLKNADTLWVAVDDVSDSMARKIISDFHLDSKMTVGDFVKSLDETRREYSAAEAFRNLLIFYRDEASSLAESEIHYQELGIHTENFCDFIKSVDASPEVCIHDYIKRLIEDIVYRHYRVSFRKMLQTRKATQKFAFENECLRFLDNWDATDTSPRIDTMRNFLMDLNIIEAKDAVDMLTESGVELLNDLKNGNTAA